MWQAVSISTVLSSQWEGKTLKGFKPASAPASAMTPKKPDTSQEKNIPSGFWLSDFCFVLKNRRLIKFHTKCWHQFQFNSVIQSHYEFAHELFLSPWWENIRGYSMRETVHILSYQELRLTHVSNPYIYICSCRTLVPCSKSSSPLLGNAVPMKLLDEILKYCYLCLFFLKSQKNDFFPPHTLLLLRSE